MFFMVLLAVPRSEAIVLKDADESILHARSDAVLTALRRIRKVEASTANEGRLRDLDERIQALESRRK